MTDYIPKKSWPKIARFKTEILARICSSRGNQDTASSGLDYMTHHYLDYVLFNLEIIENGSVKLIPLAPATQSEVPKIDQFVLHLKSFNKDLVDSYNTMGSPSANLTESIGKYFCNVDSLRMDDFKFIKTTIIHYLLSKKCEYISNI